MDPAYRYRKSTETLHLATRNDPVLRSLVVDANPNNAWLRREHPGENFYFPTGAADLARLGTALGNNTNLRKFTLGNGAALARMDAGNGVFLKGLEQNTSIVDIRFFRMNMMGGFEREIMNRVANKNSMKFIGLHSCEVDTGSLDALAFVLSGCQEPTYIAIMRCNIDDGLLGEFTTRFRGIHQLRRIYLKANNFGRAGCEAISTLLRDPSSNLLRLDLSRNRGIDDDCARIIANALEGNRKLVKLNLSHCAVTASGLDSAFSKILCNPSTVNKTYLSNHTLRYIEYHHDLPTNLSLLLGLNPIDKILRAHFNLDMTKMLEWDQKLLPSTLFWLDKARQCSTAGSHNVEAKSLSIIYQFVRALPMAAVPPTEYELKEITRHHGLKAVKSKDGYVVGDRVYTDHPSSGPWGYVVGHTGSSVFVTMNHTNIEGEIIQRKNRSVWNAPMLFDEATLAARQQREQLNAITLRHGLKRDWNEDGYAVGDRVHLNPFVGSGNCSKRHRGIRGHVVGHTRSSVWVAMDHTRVDGAVLERRSSSVSTAPMHR